MMVGRVAGQAMALVWTIFLIFMLKKVTKTMTKLILIINIQTNNTN